MNTKKILLTMLLLLTGISSTLLAQTAPSTSLPFNGRLYTTTADFHEGSLLSVNTNIPDQLQLDQPGRPLPYVNIACSNRGTVVRINIETGAIVGEYLTCPAGRAANPSRTTVDKEGNVWVTNRDEASSSGGFAKGSVTRIGVVIGGTRCDASGNPDPGGQYLKPPFFYNTCIDRNADGLIKTSLGLGNILPWNNPGGVNNDGGVSGADDEAIITYTRVRATGARTVAIDNNNDLWVGGSSNRYHEKLKGSYIPLNGVPVAGSLFNEGCGGYGGFIDGNGVLWSSSGSGAGLLRFVPNTTFPPAGTATELNGVGNYGLGVDPITGEVWHTASDGNKIYKLNSSGTLLGSYSHGWDAAQGCAVDAIGNVWVAHALFPTPSTTVGHLRTDGTFIGNVTLPNGGAGPTGVAVDANGKIWVACYNSNQAFRIDPNAGPIVNGYPLGEVDLTVDLGPGANPYNYSDMTGYVVINATVPSGTWTVIHDGGTAGIKWGQMNWTDSVPAETNVEVSARASDQLLTLPAYDFVPVQKGQSFCCAGVTGRYVEIRVKLSRQATVNVSPILYDLSIQSCDIYPNIPPTIQSSRGCNSDTIKIAAGQTLQFNISAADADAGQVVNISAEGLPANATMTPPLPATGNPTTTTFSWPTTLADLGVYNLSFAANDLYCYAAVCPAIINVVPCPSIRCSGAGISCLDSCNARASVTILGDPINYTYTWNTNPPQYSSEISRLCPGTYKVITYDGAACLDSCSITIANEPCGGFRTHTQGGYGATPKGKNVAAYLKSKFPSVFPTGLTIGCNNKLKLTTWQAVVDFLPSGSTPRALPAGMLTNPGQSYQNVLAGQLVAATLNVKFDSASANFSPNPILLKDLVIAYGTFSGWTISRLIEEANKAIGGCGSAYSFSALNSALDMFNNNYNLNEYMNSPLNNRCFLSCPIDPTSGSLRPVLSFTNPEDEIVSENELLVYPNPANEKLNLKFTAAESGKIKIELLSNMGSKVREITNSAVQAGDEVERTIPTYQLTPGMYWVRVTDDSGNQLDIKKVIIRR